MSTNGVPGGVDLPGCDIINVGYASCASGVVPAHTANVRSRVAEQQPYEKLIKPVIVLKLRKQRIYGTTVER